MLAIVCCLACRSQPTIFISASFVPSLLVGYRKVYSVPCEADVVMTSPTPDCDSYGRRMCSVRFGAPSLHDPHRVLAGFQPLAFVRDELFLDVGVCILRSAYRLRICRELGIATFTNAKYRDIILSFDDPKLAFRHALSFPQDGPVKAGINLTFTRTERGACALRESPW